MDTDSGHGCRTRSVADSTGGGILHSKAIRLRDKTQEGGQRLFLPRLDTLSHHQRRLWTELRTTPPGFVLYGGTALALRLAHRRPDDFSFLSAEPLDPLRLLDQVPYLRDAEVIRRGSAVLTCIVDRGGIVRVSFAGGGVRRRVEDPELAEPPGVEVASVVDLAAATVQAVQSRSSAKDYLDMDAILRLGGISLSEALGAATAVFGDRFNPMLTLKALTFFGDGNLHMVPDSVRERLVRAVQEVDPDRIPQLTARPGLLPGEEPDLPRPRTLRLPVRKLPG
ncbi:MAG: hypothetical protein OXH08_03800 [Gammaproteobacteria bacterium]|nr:hypothetical protein [Gammaproteobacteria bacterium]MDE0650415.1 hypothetical protein [Gammaproteobacteria bacterium]